MRKKSCLFFIIFILSFVCFIGCSTADDSDDKKAAAIFEPMKSEVVNRYKHGKILEVGPTAYHKECMAFFSVKEEKAQYYLVVYFSPGKWKLHDIFPPHKDLTKLFPEAKYELIAAGYFEPLVILKK